MNPSFSEQPKGINGQLKILKHAIKYLSKVDSPVNILNNEISYEALYYTQKILHDENFFKSNQKWKIFETSKKYLFDKLIIEIWTHLNEIFDEINFPIRHPNESEDILKTTSQNGRRVNAFDFVITITHSITANQFLNETLSNFNLRLFKLNILQPILSILRKESLQMCLTDKSNVYIFDLLVGVLAILLDISENPLNDKKIWLNLKSDSVLNTIKGWVNSYSFIIDEILMNINKKSLEETIEFLKLQPIDETFIQNEQIYVDLLFMFKLVHHENTFKKYKIIISYDCRSIFLNILKYFYENRSNLIFSFKIKYDYPNRQASLDERKLSIFNYVNLIINNLVFGSIEMAIYFNFKEILSIWISFLNDGDFMNKAMVSNPAVVSNLVNNLTLMSKYSDDNKIDWIDLNIKDSIKGLINSRYMNIVWYKNINEKIKASALKCLSNLLHGHEIARVTEFDFYVKQLLEYLNDFGKILSEKGKVIRKETEIMTDQNEIILVKTVWHEKVSVIGKLIELKRFASCLKFKKLIFSQCSQTIKLIIFLGNNVEKIIALKLITQLCLGYLNATNDLNSDEKFIQFVLMLNEKQSNLELKRTTDSLLWLLDKFSFKSHNNKFKIVNTESVMISYNYTQRETVLKLKDDLNKLGFNKIWLNLHELNGCSLSETLKAIESSKVVLVCVCEKYLFSEYNQIEARYANKLNKPIIGLIIQNGSEQIKCWLEDILNKDSMNINLFKQNWCESLIKLDLILNDCLEITKTKMIKYEINNQIENWTKEQVNDWFINSHINSILIKNYSNFDGYLLKQLYTLRKETPEFFIQSIFNECYNDENNPNDQVKLTDIVFFMDKLEKLFNQK